MTRLIIPAAIAAFLLGLAFACSDTIYSDDTSEDGVDGGDDDDNDDNDNDDNDDSGGDSDIDTDIDTDTDADSDSDSDSDTGDDTDKDTDCPKDSAYPCPCDPAPATPCDDGSTCIAPNNGTVGVCTWECSGDSDSSCDAGDWGVPQHGGVCGTITSASKKYCGVICKTTSETADCPPELTCTDITGGGVCTGS